VLAVTVWIVVGLVAIALLGVVCDWVLKARSGLEVDVRTDADRAHRPEADAQLPVLHIENARGGRGLTG
jgi:hypothetical protein